VNFNLIYNDGNYRGDLSKPLYGTAAVLDRFPAACCLLDTEGGLLDCNEAWARKLGFKSREEAVLCFADTLPEYQPGGVPSSQLLRGALEEADRDGEAGVELLCVKADGAQIYLNIDIRREGSGCFVGCAADISRFKLSKSVSEPSEEADIRHLMLDAAPMSVFLYGNPDMNMDYCNQEAMKLYGMTDKQELLDALNMHDSIDVHLPPYQPDGRESAQALSLFVEQAFQEGCAKGEFVIRKADGAEAITDTTWLRLKSSGGYVVAEYSRDLIDIKLGAKKAYEASERAQMFLDIAPMLVTFWDMQGNLIDCNYAVLQIFGVVAKEEFIEQYGKFFPKYQPCGTGSKEKAAWIFEQVKQQGYHRDEWVYELPDGEQIPFDSHMISLKRGGEDVVVGYNHDLRQLKAVAKKEQEASELAKMFIDSTSMFVEFWDSNHNFIDCNHNAVELFGVSGKDEYFERYIEFMPEFQPCGTSSHIKLNEILDLTLRDGYHRLEWMHLLPGGELMPVDFCLVRMKRGDEHIVVGYNHDLRDIKKAIAEVREADERANLMLDATPLSCYLLKAVRSESGKIIDLRAIDCNEAVLGLFGFESKEEAKAGFWSTFCNDYTTDEGFKAQALVTAETALEKGYIKLEAVHRNTDGEDIPCSVTLVRLNYKGEAIVAAYIEDLRQIKAMLREIERIEIAEEESRAKTRFLARMSHEIRTPLNAIIGVTEIQLQKDIHPEETEDAFVRIYRSSSLLHTIINDILDLSKVEAGKLEIISHPYEMISLIVDTVQLNLMHVGSKIIDFKLNVDERLPLYLVGDDLRIKQILNNVLSNAFKYTNEGTVSLSINMKDIDAAGQDDEIMLEFIVKDTGQGMTQEQIDTIFDYEFTRFNIKLNRAIEGSGLGMNIAYQLATMMNGTITGESKLGEGSTFTVRIPQKRGSVISIGKDAAESLSDLDSTKSTFKKMSNIVREPLPYGRVLVVDDVESNLFVAKGLMMPYKLNIETADSGYEAVEKITAGEVYDIIFMDHMMPGMDGIQATKIIRGMGYQNPIVALTANVVKGQVDIFMNNGFSGFVSKPIDVKRLDECLMHFIRDKQTSSLWHKAKFYTMQSLLSREGDVSLSDVLPSGRELHPGLVRSFLMDADKAIGILQPICDLLTREGSVDEEALKLYTSQVHGMKSALFNIGQKQLSQDALALEVAGRGADFKTLEAGTPDLLMKLRALVKSLACDEGENGGDEDEDPEFLREQLQAFCAACEAYDKRSARQALKAMKGKRCSKKTNDMIGEISTLLLQGDFEDAVERTKRALLGD